MFVKGKGDGLNKRPPLIPYQDHAPGSCRAVAPFYAYPTSTASGHTVDAVSRNFLIANIGQQTFRHTAHVHFQKLLIIPLYFITVNRIHRGNNI